MDRQDQNYCPSDANRQRSDGQYRDNMDRQDQNYCPSDANRQRSDGQYRDNMDRQDQNYCPSDANRQRSDGQYRDNMVRQDQNYCPSDANRQRSDGQYRDNMDRQDQNYCPSDANRQRSDGQYRDNMDRQDNHYSGQQRDNTEKQDNNYGPQDANRRGPVATNKQEDKKQEGPQDTNRKISGGQNTQEDEIQEVFPHTSKQQKLAGNSQNKNKIKNKTPNNEGGSRLEDFPGMTLTQRAHEMFLEAAIKAPSGEARQLVDRLAKDLQAMGQNALDVALSRHRVRAETAKNQSDTIRQGYENFRFGADVLINMTEYQNEELIGILRQILEETKYVDDQFKLEQESLDEFLNRIHAQRAERDKRKLAIPNYEAWSCKRPKGKDSARPQERKTAETKTSYADAAKADTAQVKKETGAISKKGRNPNGSTETSERTQKGMKEDEKGEDSNEEWITPKDNKEKYKKRQVHEEKKKKVRDEEEQGLKPRASKDVRKDSTYTKEGQTVEEVTMSSTDDQDDRKSTIDRRRQKATDSDSDRQEMPDKKDSTTHNMAPPIMGKKK